MATEKRKMLEVRSRDEWRRWLKAHHAAETAIWLVFYRRSTGGDCLDYEAAVEEAICFGWIDSLVKRLDADRYARKFTPRKPQSKWSTINRKRFESLNARGLLAAPGRKRPPTALSGDAPRPSLQSLPAYIEMRLRANARAWDVFQKLAPSYRRNYIAWIDSAKKPETKEKRLEEAIRMLEAGKPLGLK